MNALRWCLPGGAAAILVAGLLSPPATLAKGPTFRLSEMTPGDLGFASSRRPRCTITGTQGPDKDLRGTIGPDVICGFRGNDDIYARQGADVVFGGRGDDVLVGRSGGDRLLGGRGWDFIMGRGGKDLHAGQRGQDCLAASDFRSGDVVNGGSSSRDHYTSDPGDRLVDVEVNNLRCRNPYDS